MPESPEVPAVTQRLVDDVRGYLQYHGIARKPDSARFIAIICEAHRRGIQLPSRSRIAETMGTEVHVLDAVLSMSIQQGVLIEGPPPPSIRVPRRLEPAAELLDWLDGKGAKE